MNRVSPRLLDWWIAYYRVEPFGLEWDQSAGVAFQIAGVKRQLAANAGVDVTELSPLKYSDFLPPDIEPLTGNFDGDRKLSVDEMHEALRTAAQRTR